MDDRTDRQRARRLESAVAGLASAVTAAIEPLAAAAAVVVAEPAAVEIVVAAAVAVVVPRVRGSG